jgi:Flp pilus assembly protein TadG
MLRDIARRFGRSRHGATAVEFALVAPAFLATLLALLQTCVFVFAQMALQDAAQEAARYFMTGQAQKGSWTNTQVISKVCPTFMFNCNNVYIVVQNYASFSAASTTEPAMYSGGQPITTYTYAPGTPGEVMVVQLIYAWPVISGPLGYLISNLPNSSTEMMGISAFRVEPYS